MRTLSIDIETYSSVDLAKSGVYRYCEAPDFEILLFGYSADGGAVEVIDIAAGETLPPEIIDALTDEDVNKWAFNAQFERICLSRWLRDHGGFYNGWYSVPQDTVNAYLDPASWRCSMVWSAYMGLPLSLEGAGAVLGLEKQKLTEGKDLIRYFSRPCAPTDANGRRMRNLPEHAPDKWARFKEYNKRDVETEISIQKKLAKFPVPDSVWEEYRLDQEINDRGVRLDMTLVHNAIAVDERVRAELITLMRELTEMDNPNSVVQMKNWLADNRKETIKVKLDGRNVSAMTYVMNNDDAARPLAQPGAYYFANIYNGYKESLLDTAILYKALKESIEPEPAPEPQP